MRPEGNILYLIGICLIVTLGGFLFGFDLSVVSGAMPFLEKEFSLDAAGLGWAVSSCVLACVAGAASAGKMADVLGRKKVLIATGIMFAISAIGSGWPWSFNAFIGFRMLGGLAIGAAAGVAPIYVAETTPARLRGRFVSFYQLSIVIGILIAYYSNYLLLRVGDDAWRWMFAVEAIPAMAFFFLLFFAPETPRWLFKNGDEKGARRVLAKIDGDAAAEIEIVAIRNTLTERKGRLRDLLKPRMLKIVIIGSLLGIFSQISGANAVFLYAPRIFAQAGSALQDSLFQTSLIGLVNLAATFVPIFLVERLGRRPLLIAGVACMALAMSWLAWLFFQHAGIALILPAILLYIGAYSSSLACLTWVVLSEIFPNRIRGEAMSIANFCLWTSNYVLLQTFPMIEQRFGIGSTFAVYAVICVIILVFVWLFIPETKGKSLEEIELQLVGLPQNNMNGAMRND